MMAAMKKLLLLTGLILGIAAPASAQSSDPMVNQMLKGLDACITEMRGGTNMDAVAPQWGWIRGPNGWGTKFGGAIVSVVRVRDSYGRSCAVTSTVTTSDVPGIKAWMRNQAAPYAMRYEPATYYQGGDRRRWLNTQSNSVIAIQFDRLPDDGRGGIRLMVSWISR